MATLTQFVNYDALSNINHIRHLVFIDSNISNYSDLAQGVIPGTKVIILEPNQDGIKQITQAFNSYNYPYSVTVHIVSHGSPGCLYLGNTKLSLDTLDKYTEELQSWFSPLLSSFYHPHPKPYTLLIYGCSVAAGDLGAEFITKLKELTGAKIAASSTSTGHASLGGNWNLEVSSKNIEVELPFKPEIVQNYQGVMMQNDALDDEYSATRNSILSVPADFGVLANDNDTNGVTPISGGTTTQGGTINLNSDGSFDYTPPTDFEGIDTFTYTNTADNSTGTVTLNVLSLNIGGQTSDWNAVPLSGSNQFDYPDDQQTGDNEADLVGDDDNPMFYIQFDEGDASNPTDGTLAFRIRVSDEKPPTGFSRNMFIGLDADLDGAIDLYVGVNNSGNADSLAMWDTGTGENISPSTTTISDPLVSYTLEATNYNYSTVSTFTDPNGTTTDINGDGVDQFLSFSFPFQDIVTQLTNQGISNVTDQTALAFVVGTATQDNSFNQDIGGIQGGIGSTTTFTDLGVFTSIVQFDGTAINDAPINNVPDVTQATDENTTLIFSSANSNQISIDDPDAENNPIKVTLTATNGAITLNSTTGLTFDPVDSSNDGINDTTLTFIGTLTDINNALDGLNFTPDTDFVGTASLQIDTDDQGNTGSGGAKTDSDTIDIIVSTADINDPPINSVPGTQVVDESDNQVDNPVIFSAANSNQIAITDSDAGSNSVQVTLTATDVSDNSTTGTITLSGTTGLTFTAGSNSSSSMTFTGSVSDINAALSGMSFRPDNNFTGEISLQIDTDDLGNTGTGGAKTDTDSVTIIVTQPAQNDAPVNTVPVSQTTNVGTDLIFSSSNGNQIFVSDFDAGTEDIEVTLTATNGTITLSDPSSVTFSTGDGTADTTMTFTGDIGTINAVLNGMSFTPSGTSAGSIEITSNDQGNTGTGGAKSDTDSVAINVNIPPTLDLDGSATGDNYQTIFTAGGGGVPIGDVGDVAITDTDDTNIESATITLTARPDGNSNESLAVNGTLPTGINASSYDSATGVLTLTGSATLADYQTAIAQIEYNNLSGANTSDRTVNVIVNDGNANSNLATSTISITVNNPPSLDLNGTGTSGENYSTIFNGTEVNIADGTSAT
ncbi:MAG: DUF4347 domain-containing protein, partial [Xenococcaceae cyanobacterium MO_188.B19]|nr:DUF4347 domain-containing protein [Xenococcaceae cyanobacterium MO_188.B19]